MRPDLTKGSFIYNSILSDGRNTMIDIDDFWGDIERSVARQQKLLLEYNLTLRCPLGSAEPSSDGEA
jgi:hypothetical protein